MNNIKELSKKELKKRIHSLEESQKEEFNIYRQGNIKILKIVLKEKEGKI